jgi:hypothetical protein
MTIFARVQERFEDIKEVTRSSTSKENRQYQGQRKLTKEGQYHGQRKLTKDGQYHGQRKLTKGKTVIYKT